MSHETHCNQGEYIGSCKYGDAKNCPVLGILTKAQYYQAFGILTTIRNRRSLILELEQSLAEVLRVQSEIGDNYYGHVSDAIWEDYSIDELLDKLGLEVEE